MSALRWKPHVKKSRFSEPQIVAVLKELDAGTPATTIARRLGVHPNTIRGWRDKYAGLETSDFVRLKQLEAENAQMRRIIARKELELDAVKDLIEKKAGAFVSSVTSRQKFDVAPAAWTLAVIRRKSPQWASILEATRRNSGIRSSNSSDQAAERTSSQRIWPFSETIINWLKQD